MLIYNFISCMTLKKASSAKLLARQPWLSTIATSIQKNNCQNDSWSIVSLLAYSQQDPVVFEKHVSHEKKKTSDTFHEILVI